jgi:uncharacterized repeat protein (TIGR01451 family)
MSDWGSAFPGQEVSYKLLLRNDRPAGSDSIRNATVSSTLPSNLEVNSATADQGGDPNVSGNIVRLNVDTLKPGEAVEITINTTIKQDVARGTLMVAQGQVEFDELERPLLSNIVTLMVVSQSQQQAAVSPSPTPPPASPTAVTVPTDTPVPTATPGPTDTPAPTSAAGAAAGATSTVAPAATGTQAAGMVNPTPLPTPKRNTVEVQPDGTLAPLPATSTGVPLAGFGLLGITMIIRTVRLHRARERI